MAQAIALVELDSIAIGVRAGDAMVKRAPVESTLAGTVHPGKYLVLVSGDVASVEEAFLAGRQAAGTALVDAIFLPGVAPAVVDVLHGSRGTLRGDALGVIETRTVAATVGAADRGVKGADVSLLEIHLADRIGGKAYCLFSGNVSDVEAAVELGVRGLERPELLVAEVVIPQLHAEMLENLEGAAEFRHRLASAGGPGG